MDNDLPLTPTSRVTDKQLKISQKYFPTSDNICQTHTQKRQRQELWKIISCPDLPLNLEFTAQNFSSSEINTDLKFRAAVNFASINTKLSDPSFPFVFFSIPSVLSKNFPSLLLGSCLMNEIRIISYPWFRARIRSQK